MGSDYRFVVFAPGKQPTVKEVDQLHQWSQTTKQRYAVGINADDGALAIAFDARAVETARSARGGLHKLLVCWEVRGSEVRERLKFIKQPTALQPVPGDLLHDASQRHHEPSLRDKQLAAQEALGRAGLVFHQTLARHAWLARVAKVVPYALMALAGVLTIIAGISIGQRLHKAPAESREQTIERVQDNAMEEALARESRDERPEPRDREDHE